MHSWILFGIVLGIVRRLCLLCSLLCPRIDKWPPSRSQAFINAAVVFVYTDAVWATASIYLYVALAIQSEGKPPQVFIACILAGALVLVALLSSIGEQAQRHSREAPRKSLTRHNLTGWKLIKKDREGQIRLAEEAEAEARV